MTDNLPAHGDDEDPLPHVVIPDLPDDSIERSKDLLPIQNRLALIISAGFTVVTILVVIGGLIGRFGAELVDPVVGAYITAWTAMAYFYFKRR